MPSKFEYHEIPLTQIKADEANAAAAIEQMLAETDQDLRDAVDMEIPPVDGISPTVKTASTEAEAIAKRAAEAQEEVDALPWYLQKPTSNNWDRLLKASNTKLPGRSALEETPDYTMDMTGESNNDQPRRFHLPPQMRKILGRFFRAQEPVQPNEVQDAENASVASDAVSMPKVEMNDYDFEQTADMAAMIGMGAATAVEQLVVEDNLNYTGAELLLHAAAGLYNGKGIDVPMYNRLPEPARVSSHRIAEACVSYFVSIGMRDKITSELTTWAPRDIEDAGPADVDAAHFDRVLINKMQNHVSIAAREEDRRLRGEMYRGLAHGTGGGRLETIDPDPSRMLQEQLAGDIPYSEAGIKDVLMTLGANLGPVLQGLYDVAPLDVSRKDLLKDAAYYVSASQQSIDRNSHREPPESPDEDPAW